MDKYNHWIGKLGGAFFRWLGVTKDQNFAITLGQTCYYSCPIEKVSEAWRAHEDCHKRQFKRLGIIGYLVRYWYYLIKVGYWDNPFEVEARGALDAQKREIGGSDAVIPKETLDQIQQCDL